MRQLSSAPPHMVGEHDRVTELAARAEAHAAALGFTMSSEPQVRAFLGVLAAAVPLDGRVLELGTGTGIATAALVGALHPRVDVTVVTVEADEALAVRARENEWPSFVQFETGDAVTLLPTLGTFDLVFADAPGGKWTGLDATVRAVNRGGFLVVDDMQAVPEWSADTAARQHRVRRLLFSHPELVAVELTWASGVVIAARRRVTDPGDA